MWVGGGKGKKRGIRRKEERGRRKGGEEGRGGREGKKGGEEEEKMKEGEEGWGGRGEGDERLH